MAGNDDSGGGTTFAGNVPCFRFLSLRAQKEETAMRRRFAFVVLTVLTLACWSSAPTPAHAWGHGWGGWGYGGWGYGGWGWGGGGYGGYPYYAGWGGYPYYGGWGWGGYPYYAGSYMTPLYYTTPYYVSDVVYSGPVYAASNPVSSYQSLYPAATTVETPPRDQAYIRVQVPANAQVLFDDTPMRQTGTDRLFRTPPLQPKAGGYSYEVTARWMANGKEHRENRVIHVTPGQTTSVNFIAQRDSSAPSTVQPAGAPAEQAVRRPGDVR